MTFSIKAAGTRDECIQQLNDEVHHRLAGSAQIVRGVLLAFMADAPQTQAVRYEINAYGNSDQDMNPALSISLQPV